MFYFCFFIKILVYIHIYIKIKFNINKLNRFLFYLFLLIFFCLSFIPENKIRSLYLGVKTNLLSVSLAPNMEKLQDSSGFEMFPGLEPCRSDSLYSSEKLQDSSSIFILLLPIKFLITHKRSIIMDCLLVSKFQSII